MFAFLHLGARWCEMALNALTVPRPTDWTTSPRIMACAGSGGTSGGTCLCYLAQRPALPCAALSPESRMNTDYFAVLRLGAPSRGRAKLDSGSSARKGVEVRVLSWAPKNQLLTGTFSRRVFHSPRNLQMQRPTGTGSGCGKMAVFNCPDADSTKPTR